jgi:hypothetical protein
MERAADIVYRTYRTVPKLTLRRTGRGFGWAERRRKNATQITGRIRSVHVVCDDFFVGDHNQFWAAKSTQEKIDNVIDWRRLKRGSD